MTTATARPRIAIIGAGFGGLAIAIELLRAGFDDLTILERGSRVGGVWRENTYPGAACDVPSPYYSFSYEANSRWPRRYSRQPDILDYLEDVSAKYGADEHVRFGAEVTSARYDELSGVWRIELGDGGSVEADVLISAVGQLSRPGWPRLEGMADFAGVAFHSAQWRHDVDLTGKRVAVIGTGASAVQFVPEIQPQVAALSLFQRTPPYLLPRLDTAFSPRRHRLFARVPAVMALERVGWWTVTEVLTVAFLYSKPLHRLVQAFSRAHMRHQVKDGALRDKLRPRYVLGCKRVLFSSDYLPAVAQPNVDVVTEPIERITAGGVRTLDGHEHEADVLIYATGFTANDFLAPMRITGRDGRELRAQWAGGARAYLGISVPRFPNLFLMYGPNTNLGSGSIVFMLECQARYIRQAIEHVARTGAPLEVRNDVEARFDRETQSRLVDGVWSRCSSWYRDASGRISTNWPGTVTEYRHRTAHFDPAAYERVG